MILLRLQFFVIHVVFVSVSQFLRGRLPGDLFLQRYPRLMFVSSGGGIYSKPEGLREENSLLKNAQTPLYPLIVPSWLFVINPPIDRASMLLRVTYIYSIVQPK